VQFERFKFALAGFFLDAFGTKCLFSQVKYIVYSECLVLAGVDEEIKYVARSACALLSKRCAIAHFRVQ
jgi:hypothetical protein